MGGFFCFALMLMCGVWVRADEVRYHGFQMDERNRLVIEQEKNVVRVCLLKRTRPAGSSSLELVAGESSAKGGRLSDLEVLAQVRTEVLKPAAPNLLRNPGERYRITVEGVAVEPGYASVVEVSADKARETVWAQVEKLRVRTHGLQNDALWHGGQLALGILSDAGFLPADLSLTVKKSHVAQTKIRDKKKPAAQFPAGRGGSGEAKTNGGEVAE
ncbi:MAG: hypothetical protein HY706_08270 [Candidatus Hydrogenedentes bacterium]|nr:hypothetical protein [Candidatus Hydrogenedentota bacterium]